MDNTVLGMPLKGLTDKEGYTISPLSALVIMKGIDSDGDEVFGVYMTENMSPLEGTGMARFASIFCEQNLNAAINVS